MQNSGKEQTFFCEVVDGRNRPLARMSYVAICRQKLVYRLALGVLKTRDNRCVLFRRTCRVMGQQRKWDILATPVPAGGGGEDAIHMMLEARGLPETSAVSCLLPGRYAEDLGAVVSLYSVQVSPLLHPSFFADTPHILLLDRDELDGLTQSVPEQFTRELLWYAAQPVTRKVRDDGV